MMRSMTCLLAKRSVVEVLEVESIEAASDDREVDGYEREEGSSSLRSAAMWSASTG